MRLLGILQGLLLIFAGPALLITAMLVAINALLIGQLSKRGKYQRRKVAMLHSLAGSAPALVLFSFAASGSSVTFLALGIAAVAIAFVPLYIHSQY